MPLVAVTADVPTSVTVPFEVIFRVLDFLRSFLPAEVSLILSLRVPAIPSDAVRSRLSRAYRTLRVSSGVWEAVEALETP
jgi:hypothetical protein